MHRIVLIIFLMLFALDSTGQNKAVKPYSIHPVPIEFDSTSIENILLQENVKRISSSLILISQESMVDNNGADLYYKKDSTAWYGIQLNYEHITIDTVNLDNLGKPELILNCYAYAYGSGGGSGTGAFIVINVDSFPTELMNVTNSCSQESFGRTYGDDTISNPAYSVEYKRNIVCKDSLIIVSSNNLAELKLFRKTSGNQCELTQIPSGTYRMIGGRLILQKTHF